MDVSLACAALVAAMCIASHGLSAQQASHESGPAYQTPVTFGFALGAETPTGAFGHDATNGVGPSFDLVVQVPLAARRLAVRGDIMVHNWFGPTGCLLSASSGDSGCGTNPLGHGMLSWSADIVARLNDPSKRWSPYVLAGAALYRSNGSDTAPPPTHAGLQAGAGFEVRTGKRTVLFAEYRYMAMGIGGAAPITFGMRF